MSTRRPSAGPIPFMRIFDLMSEMIAGESIRGGASMAVLRVDHPDIRDFINVKREPEEFGHFNLSVMIPDGFMKVAEQDDEYSLVNPRTGSAVDRVRAAELLDEIAWSAWECGDPEDRIKRDNPTPSLGRLEATNPCGGVPLLVHEACCLGSLNFSKFVRTEDGSLHVGEVALSRVAADAVYFLDSMVEASHYPTFEIEDLRHANRKVGLGVMGWADLRIMLGIPYGSRQATAVAGRLMSVIQRSALEPARCLAVERGPFANFPISVYALRGASPRRNATVTSVTPAGASAYSPDVSVGSNRSMRSRTSDQECSRKERCQHIRSCSSGWSSWVRRRHRSSPKLKQAGGSGISPRVQKSCGRSFGLRARSISSNTSRCRL